MGCGNGMAAAFLAQEYSCSTIGIDSSEKMIALDARRAEAKELARKVEFLVAEPS